MVQSTLKQSTVRMIIKYAYKIIFKEGLFLNPALLWLEAYKTHDSIITNKKLNIIIKEKHKDNNTNNKNYN